MTQPMTQSVYPNFNESNEIKWFADWIYARMGVHFANSKFEILGKRLESLALRIGFRSLAELRDGVLAQNPKDIYLLLADTVTTHHTHFFRETSTLSFFIEKVLPTIKEDQVRVWSAASSSGEELYTIALMAINRLGIDETRRRIKLLGTDISVQSVSEAEAGVYNLRKLEGMDNQLIQNWFKPVGLECYEISPKIRELCTFRRLNLMSAPWPFSRNFHVIFLRNVLYYFDRNMQRSLLLKVHAVTVKGGYLFTSVTESLSELDTPWRRIDSGVYIKD